MDIQTQEDVQLLVNTFYGKVQNDATLGPIFNGAIKDWSMHLPKMYRFWGTVLLGEPGYSGNAMSAHIQVNKTFPLKEEHYNRWITLWEATVDSLFSGPVADNAKKRASLMIQLISFKVDQSQNRNFIQ